MEPLYIIVNILFGLFLFVAVPIGLKIFRYQGSLSQLKDHPRYESYEKAAAPSKPADLTAQYDYVIVGGGICGLMIAAIFSKLKKKCLLIEQSAQLGGSNKTLSRNGFTFNLTPPQMGNRSSYKQILRVAGSCNLKGVKLTKYQETVFSNFRVAFQEPESQWASELKKKFPEHRALVDKVLKKIKSGVYLNGFLTWNNVAIIPVVRTIFRCVLRIWFRSIYNKSVDEVLVGLGVPRKSRLFNLLVASTALGVPSAAKLPFIVWAWMMKECATAGALFLQNNTEAIVQTLLLAIQTGNGAILMSEKVNEIILDAKK